MRFLALALLLASCGKPKSPTPSPTPSASAVAKPAGFGTIVGFVQVAPGVDISPLLGRTGDFAATCHSATVDSKLFRVSTSRGLADAFVELEGGPDDFKNAAAQILDQKSCIFSPPVLVVAPGEVLVRNSDTMPHNTSLDARINSGANLNLPAGKAQTIRLSFEEKMRVRCSIHPWMTSALIVTRNPVHALTDLWGRFRLERVPAGKCRLKVWHQFGDEMTVEVNVPTGGTIDLPIEWKPRPGFRDGR